MHPSGTETRKIGRKTIILVAVALVISTLTVYTFYNINGHSFDVTNREVRLIITDSMEGEPTSYDVATIEKDSLVMVRFLSDGEKYELKQGDVVQFKYGNILNHHRVVENHTDEGYIITKGDNTSTTEKVYYANIRGEVVGSDHLVGEIFTFVKNYYFVIIAAIVTLFIGSLLLEEIRREKKEEKS